MKMMLGKSLIQNIWVLVFSSVFSLLVLFGVGELYLGTKFDKRQEELILKKQKLENKMSVCFTHSPNPELIYTFVPHSVDNNCEANSHGYRDYEFDYQKANGIYRVLIIGDSVAQGYGVKLEETFAKVLEKQLGKQQGHEEYKVEVIILARAGYSTSQELILLKEEAMPYSPDLVIWSYVLNDPADPLFHNANGELGKFFYRPNIHTLHWIKRQIFFTNEKSKSKSCKKEYHELLHCVYWQQVESHINQIGNFSKQRNIPIVFLIHPVIQKDKSYQEYSLTALHKKLGHLATKTGLIVIDILDAYKAFHSDDITQVVEGGYDPWHPNVLGHRIIAEYIFNKMREGQYIQKRLEGQAIATLKAEGSIH